MIRNSHITTAIIAINNSIVTNKSAKVLMGRVCNNEYTSKAKAALPDNDSLMMFLTISSFSLKDKFVPLINITQTRILQT